MEVIETCRHDGGRVTDDGILGRECHRVLQRRVCFQTDEVGLRCNRQLILTAYIDLTWLVAAQLLQVDGESLATCLLTLYVEGQHQRGIAVILSLCEGTRVGDVISHESLWCHEAVTILQRQRLGCAAVCALNHHVVPLQCGGFRVCVVQIVQAVGLVVRCQRRDATATQLYGDGIGRHRERRAWQLRLHRAVCLEDIDAHHRHDSGAEYLLVTIQITEIRCL